MEKYYLEYLRKLELNDTIQRRLAFIDGFAQAWLLFFDNDDLTELETDILESEIKAYLWITKES